MFLRNLLPGIYWAIFILVVCVIPIPKLSDAPEFKLIPLDKVVHFVLYAFLLLLLAKGFKIQTSKAVFNKYAILIACVSSFIYGIIIEIIQAFIPYRSAGLFDIAANLAGCLVGIILYMYLKRFPRFV